MKSDICPGYQINKTGELGCCCCGLYWVGRMPLHLENGTVVKDEEGYFRRVARRIDTSFRNFRIKVRHFGRK